MANYRRAVERHNLAMAQANDLRAQQKDLNLRLADAAKEVRETQERLRTAIGGPLLDYNG